MAYNEGDSSAHNRQPNEPRLDAGRGEWVHAVFRPLGQVPMYQVAAAKHGIGLEASLGGQRVTNSRGLLVEVPEGRAHIRLRAPLQSQLDSQRIKAFCRDLYLLTISLRRRGLL
ncbi:hypothetical protein A2631_06015 [Candidatus Daviesbacteria bacterium RIFCSPHIGHO2_01_FULL_44_29]|uniref:Uncharacterized protein n=1 Tax=Candidatus Daviesbacteria bacterium RIFCSPHIGHO2_02_FULL_43_12 TaxID=1797776 RepID=A0A1F5KJZ7_9BACT|nr:MAG: hypothetical protein A2631_06015 [Candidatus Daviesbacteria bacterium RIFCSPHIGHO2_01_FULL_44_29]OGE39148.1 MAG: hypothetical protein A3E86_03345 [Candidatus Daviesbacteria bacterium RIFCSPHIGHO2_12_FULL_47_45]OGE40951.1 MAG: hypothetical protein A3D25_02845 [Candidatus Daviesbacteria bacterium RIFCSPHIGHO2_02_FULL_43_12]OGE69898.1 MAG: hypothetical protein A3B55_05825 [Candidatus Daviesbacteria bacterium RIFCSPLOWO2_01_FULL_43_15]